MPADHEILFVPDRHLGQYLEEVTGRKMILWDGSCMVHEIFSVGDLLTLKKKLPARDDDRPPGVPGQHPRAQRLRRRHRGDDQVRRRLQGADRLPRRHRSEHDVAAADAGTRSTATTRCRASPAPATSARTWPATRWRSSATAWSTASPEITWQPEFDRAKRGAGAEPAAVKCRGEPVALAAGEKNRPRGVIPSGG